MAFDMIRAWLIANAPKARTAMPDAFWIVGLALVAFGIGMIYLPAGVIAAGAGACFVGYVVGDAE